MSRKGVFEAWIRNPFFVLGLGIAASRLEIERVGQKLVGLLSLGGEAAGRYETPFGPATRTVEDVRTAVARLRDPDERVTMELLAEVPPMAPATPREAAAEGWTPAGHVPGWSPE